MNIVHIIRNSNVGGAQIFVYDLIPPVTEQMNCHFVLFTESNTGGLSAKLSNKQVKFYLLRKPLLPFRPYRLFHLFRSLQNKFLFFQYLNRFIQIKPNLVHVHLFKIREVSTIMRACIFFRLPIVWTMHGELIGNNKELRKLQKVIEIYDGLQLPLFFAYVGDYPSVMSKIQLPEKVKIIHIPSGINTGEFIISQEIKQKYRKRMFKNEDLFIIGYAGRLSEEKGVDLLLKAVGLIVNQIPNCLCLIAGDGPDRKLLEQLTFSNNIQNHIKFLGEIDNMIEFYSLLDLYIQPSRSEGLPLSVLEAMASEIPVIASDVGGMHYVIRPNISGLLISRENPVELANAINYLFEHPKLRSQFSSNAKKIVEEYDIRSIREKYDHIYSELVNL